MNQIAQVVTAVAASGCETSSAAANAEQPVLKSLSRGRRFWASACNARLVETRTVELQTVFHTKQYENAAELKDSKCVASRKVGRLDKHNGGIT